METQTQIINENGNFPNNGKLPLVLYPGAVDPDSRDGSVHSLDPGSLAHELEVIFTRNYWPPAWRDGVYPYHHYHSVAHEALGVYSGRAKLQCGGNGGPVLEIGPGDVIVIPAGVAHKLISSEGNLGIVGAYPQGQSPDLRYGKSGERPEADKNIAATPLPGIDPVLGRTGPVAEEWGR